MNKILANLIFLTHVAFGLWLLIGWMLTQWQLLYIASLLTWIGSWVLLGFCPLTYVEFWLRQRAGQDVDISEEFIRHYTKKVFGIYVPMSAIYVGGIITFCVLLSLSIGLSY